MDELDVLLSASLKRVAQPGDPAGVADAIRDRVAAGDTGAPASTSGFGPRRWWVLWLGVGVVVVLVTGGAVAFGTVLPTTVVASPTATVVASPTPTVTPTRTATPTPSPTPTPVVTPTVEPEPEPEPDTTAPVIVSAASDPIYGANGSMPIISAVVTDDTGVASVAISWKGVLNGSASMTGDWSYALTVPPGTPAGALEFTVVAMDAAGNTSAPYVFSVNVTL